MVVPCPKVVVAKVANSAKRFVEDAMVEKSQVVVAAPIVEVPIVALLEKRFVEDAVVEKSVVVVALLKSVVEARSVPPCKVVNDEEAEEMKPCWNVWSWVQVLAVPRREEPLTIQLPPLYVMHPVVRLMPLEKVEVAPPPWVIAPVLETAKRVVVELTVEDAMRKRFWKMAVDEVEF